jgi:hypothetical protein
VFDAARRGQANSCGLQEFPERAWRDTGSGERDVFGELCRRGLAVEVRQDSRGRDRRCVVLDGCAGRKTDKAEDGGDTHREYRHGVDRGRRSAIDLPEQSRWVGDKENRVRECGGVEVYMVRENLLGKGKWVLKQKVGR